MTNTATITPEKEVVVEDRFVQVFNRRYNDYVQSKKKVFPHHVNRASDIGHAFTCLRLYVYKRLKWQEQGLPSDDRVKIFEKGNEEEDNTVNFIQSELNARYYRWDPLNHLFDEEHKLSGTPDGFLELTEDGEMMKYGIDIKSSSGLLFPKINTLQDLIDSAHFWYAYYVAQAQSYMGLSGEKVWYLLFSNKQQRDYTLIRIDFDEEMYQSILDKCKEINAWVEKNDFPDRITYDPAICNKCDFFQKCQPREYFIQGCLSGQVIDQGIIDECYRRSELKEDAKEHNALKEKHKEMFKGIPATLIGDNFFVESKPRKDGVYVTTMTDENKGEKI